MVKVVFAKDKEWEDIYKIRKEVFVEEQGVSLEDEFDDYDLLVQHILIYHDGKPVGTGRLRFLEDAAKFERICVRIEARKLGLGSEIINSLEKLAKEEGNVKQGLIHAQTQALSFYEKLGFVVSSEEFMEDGIPHVKMLKTF
ncbi:MAG: GNAT family N-acetyltransferase [Desulfitobacterium sp.]|nr:GNAT family N-acetyltransferase [Desulfitobacterium sp.]